MSAASWPLSLHDAKVLSVSFGKHPPRVALRLRLEGSKRTPGKLLELLYRPVGGPNGGVAIRKPEVSDASAQSLWVLYNEFDADEDRGFFTHTLLLTGAIEMSVRFHSLSILFLDEDVSPLELEEEERTWPLVEV